MEFYFFIVIVLFVLAASDLIVGVSNDAVNFLNSALGSKVASRRTIMIIVSLGILVGVTFSSGMMEVARKGIFNPQHFYFNEVMIIFIAVMITDIFLLDLFNTFGMPTSTTVSIVFELLGAAVAMAFIKVFNSGGGLNEIGTYINSSSALTIITSILMSVAIAFIVGTVVMYLSRLLFSFHYHNKLKTVGILWSGLAFSLLTYFLVFKGLKGASFVSKDAIHWVSSNLGLLLGGALILWTVILTILHYAFKVNVLRLVVLFGTFSLAMAFAGNDLVNFIGVPMAGLESYRVWSSSGVEATALSMDSLSKAVRADTYLLLIAGAIMIITLWLSKKARTVTETEINLGRQNEGSEKFSPNALSRGIVKYSLMMGNGLKAIMPSSVITSTEKRFRPVAASAVDIKEKPAFDLVRASVNLTVASMLIALATSYKLPLSTTYVSFMVAMGTSLADRAWGRDSAVYRVAGVMDVIGGWFATAAIAFVVAGINAWLIYKFGWVALIGLLALLIFFIVKSFAIHDRKSEVQDQLKSAETDTTIVKTETLIADTKEQIIGTLNKVRDVYSDAITALVLEDRSLMRKAKDKMERLHQHNEVFKRKLYGYIKRLEGSNEAARMYLLIYDMDQDVTQSVGLILNACDNHVSNFLNPLSEEQKRGLEDLGQRVSHYLDDAVKTIESGRNFDLESVVEEKSELLQAFEEEVSHQIDGIKADKYGMRNSMLIFSLELETKDLISVTDRFLKVFGHKLVALENEVK